MSVSGDHGQSNGGKHAVGVDPQFVSANARGGPSTVVEHHLKRDVVAVQGPIQSNLIQGVAVSVGKGRVQVEVAVRRYASPLTLNRDEGETPRPNLKGGIGHEHGARGIVKPAAVKTPGLGCLGLHENVGELGQEFLFSPHRFPLTSSATNSMTTWSPAEGFIGSILNDTSMARP